ncbi:MAG: hypothetical protein ABI611_10495 [Solirubrobacteraceae bacterium]
MRMRREVETTTAVAPPARSPGRPEGLSMHAVRAAVSRARTGDPAAIALLRQVAGEGATAAPPTPAPAPCRLTPTTAPDLAGDLTDGEALEATRTLPAHVQRSNIGSDCQRREFMRWAREWFGTYRAAIEHFSAIETANVPGSPLVHRDARARLEAVAAELAGSGGHMPSTSTAFAFRSTFAGKHPSPASMHTLGYALDYDAVGMPQMGQDEMALLIELMTGGPANAQILDYSRRRDAIRRMGDRTAAGTETALASDRNATAVLSGITTELARLTQASTAFQAILGATARDEFLELRTQYFEAAAGDRAAVLARVQPLLAPLFAAIGRAEGEAGLSDARRAMLARLRTKLTDAAFLFGAARRPRGGGRPTTAQTHTSPSLAQLFEHGWFAPGDQGGHWGVEFATAMARHGFEGGYVWGGATQDSMHFELVVARPYTPPRAPAAASTGAAGHGHEH